MTPAVDVGPRASVVIYVAALAIAGVACRHRVERTMQPKAIGMLVLTSLSSLALWSFYYGTTRGTFYAGLTVIGFVAITFGDIGMPLRLQDQIDAAQDPRSKAVARMRMNMFIARLVGLGIALWFLTGQPGMR